MKEEEENLAQTFENDEIRSQKLLAVLDGHNSPVNCVRWNNLGTLFASAGDDGTIILWEYNGIEKMDVNFQRAGMEDNDEDVLMDASNEESKVVE